MNMASSSGNPPVTNPTPRKRKRATEVIDLTASPVSTPRKTPSKRRKTTPPPTPAEKRAKRWRDHPPQNLMVKHERVMTQRMFLVERSGCKNGTLEEEFCIIGSVGNVYTVTVGHVPRYLLAGANIDVPVQTTCHIKPIANTFYSFSSKSSNYQNRYGIKLRSSHQNSSRFFNKSKIVITLFPPTLHNTIKLSRMVGLLILSRREGNPLRVIVLFVLRIYRNLRWRIQCTARRCAGITSTRNVLISGRRVNMDMRLLAFIVGQSGIRVIVRKTMDRNT
jgi:hypothetical protein